MRYILLVGIGSFFGGIFRYLLSTFIQSRTTSIFPYGTLVVNLVGCLLIGCLFGATGKWQISQEVRLTLITGLLGGFTTFSAFSMETVILFKAGYNMYAITYMVISVIVGVFLTFVGAWAFES